MRKSCRVLFPINLSKHRRSNITWLNSIAHVMRTGCSLIRGGLLTAELVSVAYLKLERLSRDLHAVLRKWEMAAGPVTRRIVTRWRSVRNSLYLRGMQPYYCILNNSCHHGHVHVIIGNLSIVSPTTPGILAYFCWRHIAKWVINILTPSSSATLTTYATLVHQVACLNEYMHNTYDMIIMSVSIKCEPSITWFLDANTLDKMHPV